MAVIFLFLQLEKQFFSENFYLYVNFILEIPKHEFLRPQLYLAQAKKVQLSVRVCVCGDFRSKFVCVCALRECVWSQIFQHKMKYIIAVYIHARCVHSTYKGWAIGLFQHKMKYLFVLYTFCVRCIYVGGAGVEYSQIFQHEIKYLLFQ